MALPQLVTISDFVGAYRLPTFNSDFHTKVFNPFVVEFQEKILIDLMGAYMFADFRDDFSGSVPQSTKYLNLLNGVEKLFQSLFCCDYKIYKGLKIMLCYYLYAEFIITNEYRDTQSGLVKKNKENSTSVNEIELLKRHYSRYNQFVEYYNDTFDYMIANEDLFPEFEIYTVAKKLKGVIETRTIQ